MEAGESFSDAEQNPGSSLLILDSQEVKKVLEIYVKRSLSNCEAKTRNYEVVPVDLGMQRSTKKWKKLKRSMSDFGKYSGRRYTVPDENKLPPKKETNTANARACKDQIRPSQKEMSEAEGHVRGIERPILKAKQGKNQPSWLKNLINFFRRSKDEDNKEDLKANHMDSNGNHLPGCPEQELPPGTCVSCQGLVKTNKKKSSLKKGFSFRKNITDEQRCRDPADTDTKSRRPSHLPLQHINKPRTVGESDSDCYYSSLSTEIEQIVKESEYQEGRLRLASSHEDLDSEDKELLIRKIASMLQKKGDEWDKKIKEDPKLNTFFQDISYTSFKQLADIYVDKQVKKKAVVLTPEEVTVAFAVHLTAKVAGICPHPVSRIMGFGNQYLQDTCPQLSYCKKGMNNSKIEKDVCQSPD
ncbi:protein BNIP5-like [Ambystoma mexicanum]|uniref:protein BNIP5-like n=1 Tax=Ambystoma mexicanum TaxID=8296 RepID=UPI0037E79CDE